MTVRGRQCLYSLHLHLVTLGPGWRESVTVRSSKGNEAPTVGFGPLKPAGAACHCPRDSGVAVTHRKCRLVTYARKLRAHDVKFGMRARASDGGPPGPLEASLANANLQVLVSGAFGEGNKGLHSFVRELAVSGAPRLQAKLALTQARWRHASTASPRAAPVSRLRAATRSSSSRASAASTCCARTATAHSVRPRQRRVMEDMSTDSSRRLQRIVSGQRP